MDLSRKTEYFKKEVDYNRLNEEQKRLYNAFVFRRQKPYRFSVNDSYRNTVRFLLYTNKRDEGVIHIMNKHYKGSVGMVTAKEIIDICNVIRYGDVTSNGKSLTYRWQNGSKILKLIVGLKKSNTGENVLKSFYSNRKTPGTACSSKR